MIDLFLSVFSTVTSLALVSYILDWNYTDQIILTVFLASLFCSTASFLVCQTYKGIIRHSAFTETGRIAMSSSLKVATILPVLLFTTGLLSFRGFLLGSVVDFFLTFFILTIFRAFLITLYTFMVSSIASNRKDKLFIFGHEDSSPALLNDSFLRENSSYQVEGFLRFGQRVSMRIGLYKVYFITDQEEFSRWVNRYNIKAILFTDYKAVKEESERLVRFCEKEKVRMLLLPSLDELKGGKLKMRALPEVRIEDLLGREEIRINMEEIATSLKGKVVLVTGAAGSIGSELCRQLCHFGLKQLVLFDSAETPMHNIRLELEEKFPDVEFTPVMGDIRMIHRVESIYQRFHPQLVFHAAAYKHVPLMEDSPNEAIKNNVIGTLKTARTASRYHVKKFILISTDKAVNPTNIMGASKRLCEMVIQMIGKHSTTEFAAVRFGNVLGSNGSVIPLFRRQIEHGGPVTVTHPDIIRYFMTIPEAVSLVLEAGAYAKNGQIFVLNMGDPVRIADLAKNMIRLSGYEPGVEIEIKYIGLRPGEKLYEELLMNEEGMQTTENSRIFIGRQIAFDETVFRKKMKELERAAENECPDICEREKRMVPEYQYEGEKKHDGPSYTYSAGG